MTRQEVAQLRAYLYCLRGQVPPENYNTPLSSARRPTRGSLNTGDTQSTAVEGYNKFPDVDHRRYDDQEESINEEGDGEENVLYGDCSDGPPPTPESTPPGTPKFEKFGMMKAYWDGPLYDDIEEEKNDDDIEYQNWLDDMQETPPIQNLYFSSADFYGNNKTRSVYGP